MIRETGLDVLTMGESRMVGIFVSLGVSESLSAHSSDLADLDHGQDSKLRLQMEWTCNPSHIGNEAFQEGLSLVADLDPAQRNDLIVGECGCSRGE